MADEEQLERLKRSVEEWNQWRREHPEIRPNLSRASLSGAYLSKAHLGSTDLNEANLSGAYLGDAYLGSANLLRTNLRSANLGSADLRIANLSGADLCDADLGSANLSDAQLIGTNFKVAQAREIAQDRTILFPLRLDQAAMETEKNWAKRLRESRHIGDFTGWPDDAAYNQAFTTLLRHLKVTQTPANRNGSL
jgi:uncharacterized protein YjbI with pentapeptide repeats